MSLSEMPNGDAGFAAFAEGEYRRLVGTLSLYCGAPAVAEDVAQDALVRALERWVHVRRLDSPRAWLYRTAFNLAHSHYRRRAAERRALERRGLDDDWEDPDVALVITVRKAVSSLPRREREVVILRYYLRLSVDETASMLGLGSGSVKVYTARAFQRLRCSLESESEVFHAG